MDTIRRADYFSLEVPNKVGEGARLLGALRDAGINLTAFTAFPSGRRAQIDFIPDDSAAFKAAARKLGIKVGPRKTVFICSGRRSPRRDSGDLRKTRGRGYQHDRDGRSLCR